MNEWINESMNQWMNQSSAFLKSPVRPVKTNAARLNLLVVIGLWSSCDEQAEKTRPTVDWGIRVGREGEILSYQVYYYIPHANFLFLEALWKENIRENHKFKKTPTTISRNRHNKMPSSRNNNPSPTSATKHPSIKVKRKSLPPIPNLNDVTPSRRISLQPRTLRKWMKPNQCEHICKYHIKQGISHIVHIDSTWLDRIVVNVDRHKLFWYRKHWSLIPRCCQF